MDKRAGLLAFGVLLLCAACAKQVKPEPYPKPVYMGLPPALIAPCVVKELALRATADLVENMLRYRGAFAACAAKVDKIRQHDEAARAALPGV